MPDRAAVLAALAEYANKPATSRDIRAEPGDTFGRPPLTTLMQFVQDLDTKADLDALLGDVARLIAAADPFRGAVIALNCGTLVEAGGDAARVFPHLLAELPRHLALSVQARELGLSPSELFDANPEAARAASGLRYFLLCLMTVVCRDAEFRRALRANEYIADAIENLLISSGLDAELDTVLDETRLEPDSKRVGLRSCATGTRKRTSSRRCSDSQTAWSWSSSRRTSTKGSACGSKRSRRAPTCSACCKRS